MSKKKIFVTSLVFCIFSLFCGICSFAADNNSMNLGNTVSDTMNKAGQSLENVKNDIFLNNKNNNMRDGVVGGALTNGTNHVRNGVGYVENGTRTVVDDGVVNNTRVNNARVTNGRTGNYNTVRTRTDATLANTRMGGMTTTTWMWIVLAISAVAIITAIWYYATQNNGRD